MDVFTFDMTYPVTPRRMAMAFARAWIDGDHNQAGNPVQAASYFGAFSSRVDALAFALGVDDSSK
jgi:hypothetical protein